jgi:hypothetical protein
MEITCTRCHQAVETDNLYCPACGLPQLMYSAENVPGQAPPERFSEPVRDASTVDWKRAMRPALALAIPAGVLFPVLYPIGPLALLVMAMVAYWVVALYVRSQRPAWITIGAGARIGLVTGLVSGWLTAATIGLSLFAMRVFMHQGKAFDDSWNENFVGKMTEQWTSMGVDAPSIALLRAWFLSPEGRSGTVLFGVVLLVFCLLLFAVGGGALGARSQAHARKPGV